MDRLLVVVDESDASVRLLREAGEIAGGLGVGVVVFALLDDDAAREELDGLWNHAGTNDSRRPETAEELVQAVAERLGDQVLGSRGVEYLARGEIVGATSPSDRIIEVVESNGCDHVFVPGARRSPTGKALFGDTAQSVLLNFDGYVTVAVDDEA
ncbi:universal stress protein [Halegenticoccus tardaugens]|uniref:universal stress protein n=1 Tax=Halegenticoccus tardaugens TaxID=2071624 RepID=UPI00100AADEB|nr:universal stress protein [Halegenticoccus tardaugens]